MRNREAFPVCFSKSELIPGYEVTSVRDDSGRILNGSLDTALELFRGVNLADSLVGLRPGRVHEELMDLAEYNPDQRPLLIQIAFKAFRCSALFDGGQADIPTQRMQGVFRLAEGQIAEDSTHHLGTGEEPPLPSGR